MNITCLWNIFLFKRGAVSANCDLPAFEKRTTGRAANWDKCYWKPAKWPILGRARQQQAPKAGTNYCRIIAQLLRLSRIITTFCNLFVPIFSWEWRRSSLTDLLRRRWRKSQRCETQNRNNIEHLTSSKKCHPRWKQRCAISGIEIGANINWQISRSVDMCISNLKFSKQ